MLKQSVTSVVCAIVIVSWPHLAGAQDYSEWEASDGRHVKPTELFHAGAAYPTFIRVPRMIRVESLPHKKRVGPDYMPLQSPPKSIAKHLRRPVIPNSNIGPTIIVSAPQIHNNGNPQFTAGLLGRSETTIGASVDGRTIVIGWNDADGFLSQYATDGISGYAVSVDGGETFVDADGLPPVEHNGMVVITRGDPWVDATNEQDATFYFASLAALSVSLEPVGVIVHRGKVEGSTIRWSAPSIIQPRAGNFLDKEALAVDKRQGSQNVYVSVTNFVALAEGGRGTQIELYRSPDGGIKWLGPSVVQEADARGHQGSAVAVGPDGEVYVVWEQGRLTGSAQILFRRSTDRGGTFDPVQEIASITTTAPYPPVAYSRRISNDFPRIAVDHTSRFRGRIYVVYQDAGINPPVHTDGIFVNARRELIDRAGGVLDGDIHLRFSDDGGMSWSEPRIVNGQRGDGANQFWPVVTVDSDGNVSVVYYEDIEVQPQPVDSEATHVRVGLGMWRSSTYQSLVDVYWALSRDGGETFVQPVPINEMTSNWSTSSSNITPNFGDYIASISVGEKVLTSWTQTHEYDIDPGPGVTKRMAPSAAFALINVTGEPVRVRPPVYALLQNYPNPFNPTTMIRFDLRERSHTILRVFDVLGREVHRLVDSEQGPGRFSVTFDGSALPDGVYFYRIETEEFRKTQKMLLLR